MTTLNLINDALILAAFVLALIAFAYMAFTLRKPLSRAFAWLCFGVYFGVTVVTLDLMFL